MLRVEMPDLTIEELLVRNVSLEKEMDSLRTMLNNVAEQRDGFRAQMEALSIEALRLKEEGDTARRHSTASLAQGPSLACLRRESPAPASPALMGVFLSETIRAVQMQRRRSKS